MLLECKNIRKHFAVQKGFLGKTTGTVKAVNNVDFSIKKGENVSLVGESGSGKSTLARVIMKLYPLTGGSIVFDGEDITRAGKKKLAAVRRNMQMVFQDPYSSLDPRYSIRKTLKEGFVLTGDKFKSEQEQEKHIGDLMKAVQLKLDMLNRYPHEFSGGERQRIAIARALVLNPRLLILDEAVSSLDVLIQEQILHLLHELQEMFDLTYLFISHNLRVVRKISRRIAVMYHGKIVESAPTEELFNNPLHPYTKVLLAAALDYKAVERNDQQLLSEHGRLIDRGNGHFVLSR